MKLKYLRKLINLIRGNAGFCHSHFILIEYIPLWLYYPIDILWFYLLFQKRRNIFLYECRCHMIACHIFFTSFTLKKQDTNLNLTLILNLDGQNLTYMIPSLGNVDCLYTVDIPDQHLYYILAHEIFVQCPGNILLSSEK